MDSLDQILESIVVEKACTKCKHIKDLTEFPIDRRSKDGFYSRCKACVREDGKARYSNPTLREKVLLNQKKYRDADPEARRASVRKSQRKHADRKSAYSKAYYQRPERKAHVRELMRGYRKDPQFRIVDNTRSRISRAIGRGNGRGRMLKTLGITTEGLMAHLESQFKPGMNWGNYGRAGWHVDHITQLSEFNLLDPEQCKVALHYTNLQPLWWHENLSKNRRFN